MTRYKAMLVTGSIITFEDKRGLREILTDLDKRAGLVVSGVISSDDTGGPTVEGWFPKQHLVGLYTRTDDAEIDSLD